MYASDYQVWAIQQEHLERARQARRGRVVPPRREHARFERVRSFWTAHVAHRPAV